MDSGRVSMSQEWSRVVSAEVKEEYMTLQSRLQDYFLPLLLLSIIHKQSRLVLAEV